jgi:endonuclease-3
MKAKHIFQTAQILASGESPFQANHIPADAQALTKLPGVGEKTAKVIQYVLYKKPVIAVDTHVHRVVNRLGIVHTSQPLQTSKKIEHKIPKKRKLDAHHALILFGRYYCKALKPHCEGCGLQKVCEFYSQKGT